MQKLIINIYDETAESIKYYTVNKLYTLTGVLEKAIDILKVHEDYNLVIYDKYKQSLFKIFSNETQDIKNIEMYIHAVIHYLVTKKNILNVY